jgi:uncharacterized SAM-binding protein YcdF (DUF218 family)
VGFLRRHPILVSVGFLLVVGLSLVAASAVAVWDSAHQDEASRIDHVDAIFVMGAAQYSGTPSPLFAARLDHAALMYRRGFASTVVVLGASQPGDITTEGAAGRQYLISTRGLPDASAVALPEGHSSFESLEAAAGWMRARGYTTAFLVSDPWHNLRIRRMGRDLGIEAYVSATFQSAETTSWTRFKSYSRETFAYLYYRVVGQ